MNNIRVVQRRSGFGFMREAKFTVGGWPPHQEAKSSARRSAPDGYRALYRRTPCRLRQASPESRNAKRFFQPSAVSRFSIPEQNTGERTRFGSQLPRFLEITL